MNGEDRGAISGSSDWGYRVVAIPPGRHTVRWTYSKDADSQGGSDRGWVDFLQLASRSAPFLMAPPHVRVPMGKAVDYQFPVARPKASFTPLPLGQGLSLNAQGEVTGNPESAGEVSFTLNIQQGAEEISMPARIEILPVSSAGEASYAASGPDWGLAWETNGSGSWISQDDETRDGQVCKTMAEGP